MSLLLNKLLLNRSLEPLKYPLTHGDEVKYKLFYEVALEIPKPIPARYQHSVTYWKQQINLLCPLRVCSVSVNDEGLPCLKFLYDEYSQVLTFRRRLLEVHPFAEIKVKVCQEFI